MNISKLKYLVPALAFFSLGCMSTSQQIGGKFAAYPESHKVLIVDNSNELPAKRGKWSKIGEVTATDNGWGADVSNMLTQKAREMGGDALVGFKKFKTTQTLGIGWKDIGQAEVWHVSKP